MADRSADICRRLYCADKKPVPTATGPPKSAQVVLPAGPLNTMSTRYRDGLEGARLIPAVLSENASRCSGVNRRWRVRVMNDDALADRRRSSDDDYFRKHDNQLIEEARQRAERDAARQRMSERVGTAANALLRTSDGDRARPLHPEVARTLHRDCRCLRRDARVWQDLQQRTSGTGSHSRCAGTDATYPRQLDFVNVAGPLAR
jgi:hypothetical protein